MRGSIWRTDNHDKNVLPPRLAYRNTKRTARRYHHPGYRTKFADNLKRELPRIPFAPDFRAFAKAGKELARLHLDYEKLEPYDLKFLETPGVPLSYRVEDKMRLSKDKTTLKVNPSLTLAGIPKEVLRAFSTRREEIEARMALRGESSARAAEIAALDTRKAKDHDVDPTSSAANGPTRPPGSVTGRTGSVTS